MQTVKTQKEDAPHDMDCHVDSEGNKFDFGYGLKSVINDKRAAKYKDKL
jgi:beta-glucosidase